jgi:hypothetical protein
MKHTRLLSILALAAFGAVAGSEAPRANQNAAAETPAWARRELRAGIIGTDTSHVPAFAKERNGAEVALSTLRK